MSTEHTNPGQLNICSMDINSSTLATMIGGVEAGYKLSPENALDPLFDHWDWERKLNVW